MLGRLAWSARPSPAEAGVAPQVLAARTGVAAPLVSAAALVRAGGRGRRARAARRSPGTRAARRALDIRGPRCSTLGECPRAGNAAPRGPPAQRCRSSGSPRPPAARARRPGPPTPEVREARERRRQEPPNDDTDCCERCWPRDAYPSQFLSHTKHFALKPPDQTGRNKNVPTTRYVFSWRHTQTEIRTVTTPNPHREKQRPMQHLEAFGTPPTMASKRDCASARQATAEGRGGSANLSAPKTKERYLWPKSWCM